MTEGAPTESFYPGPHTLAEIDAGARDELLHLFPALRRGCGAYGPAAKHALSVREAHLLAARGA